MFRRARETFAPTQLYALARRDANGGPPIVPPNETSRSDKALADRYPISLISPKPHAYLNSQYANEPVQQRRQGEQTVVIHPNDAANRSIGDGDLRAGIQ